MFVYCMFLCLLTWISFSMSDPLPTTMDSVLTSAWWKSVFMSPMAAITNVATGTTMTSTSTFSLVTNDDQNERLQEEVLEFGRDMRLLCEEMMNMTQRYMPTSSSQEQMHEKGLYYCRHSFGYELMRESTTTSTTMSTTKTTAKTKDWYWVVEDTISPMTMLVFLQRWQETMMMGWKSHVLLEKRGLHERFVAMTRIVSRLMDMTERHHQLKDQKRKSNDETTTTSTLSLMPFPFERGPSPNPRDSQVAMFLMERDHLMLEWAILMSDMRWLRQHFFPESMRMSMYTEDVQKQWNQYTDKRLAMSKDRWNDWTREKMVEYTIPFMTVGHYVVEIPRQLLSSFMESTMFYVMGMWLGISLFWLMVSFVRQYVWWYFFQRWTHVSSTTAKPIAQHTHTN